MNDQPESVQEPERGWGFPSNSKKAHYFHGGRSLCSRWAYWGHLEQGDDESPDNCRECVRRKKRDA